MKRIKSIYFYLDNLGKGGAERVCIELANYFYKQDINVKIITSDRIEDEYQIPNNISRENLTDNENSRNKYIRNILLINKLRKIINKDKPDIIISFMQKANMRSVISSIGTKTKSVISVRNDPKYEYSGLLGEFIGKKILPLADLCIFQTEEAKEWFPKKLQLKSKVIMNPVRDSFFNVTRKPVKNRFVTFGRLEQQKNHKLLIDAFSKVVDEYKDAELLIFGKGSLENILSKKIKEKNLSNNIKICGFTDDVVKQLEEADVFVLSSNFEGLPNSLMESLAAGVPSISTDCPSGGPRKLISNYYNGILVPTHDENALSEAMKLVLSDYKLKELLSKNAKKESKMFKTNIIYQEWSKALNLIL